MPRHDEGYAVLRQRARGAGNIVAQTRGIQDDVNLGESGQLWWAGAWGRKKCQFCSAQTAS